MFGLADIQATDLRPSEMADLGSSQIRRLGPLLLLTCRSPGATWPVAVGRPWSAAPHNVRSAFLPRPGWWMPYRGQASAAVLQFWLDTPVSPNPEETGYAHLIRSV